MVILARASRAAQRRSGELGMRAPVDDHHSVIELLPLGDPVLQSHL
jgi:hypothetical protein